MAQPAFCGVDIGTTHMKAVLIGEQGEILSIARARTPVTDDGYGPCHDPESLRSVVEGLMVDAQQRAEVATSIHSIGVTSVGEEGVPIDAGGEILYPAIAWYDRRSSPAVEAWWAHHTEDDIHHVSGLHADLGFTLFKWLWLRSFQPDAWKRCTRWLGIGDYVAWRWTGNAAMSVSHASRTCVFDLQNSRWYGPWVADVLAHGVDTLPPLLPAGGVIGFLSEGAIPQLVVEKQVPVVATGLDHLVGCYAAGIRRGGELMDSLGTAEAIVAPASSRPSDAVWRSSRADFGAGLLPDSVIGLAGLASGAGLQRVRDSFGAGSDESARDLERAAAEIEPGAGGAIYVPSRIRESGTGAWAGAGATGPAAQQYRAVLEGWCIAAAEAIDALSGPDGEYRGIATTGGGTQSTLWVRIKASVLDCPIRVVRTPELVGVGAALFGARSAGATRMSETWAPATHEVDVVEPEPSWVDHYSEQRHRFQEAAAAIYPDESSPLYP